MPALVVAMAGKPTCSRIRAEPASQAFGMHEAGAVVQGEKGGCLGGGQEPTTSTSAWSAPPESRA